MGGIAEDGATAPPASPAGPPAAAATVGLFAALFTALVPFFVWAGRREWFEHDDWDYLVNRKAGDLGDLVRPHNGHWETVPVLVYRALWSAFGLSYRPYQLVSIVMSGVAAALLVVIMLRARTRPWIAFAAATLLVLFGDAQVNVALRVTSITFVGFAVPLGLVQLLLADHDGPLERRDAFGLACGLVAVLCSDVAVAMLLVVGIVVLVKRGWRLAAFHVLAPAVAFVAWYLAAGRTDTGAGAPARLRPLPQAVHFASVLVTGVFESLTRAPAFGGVLVLALLAGVGAALSLASPARRRETVVPVALLAGALFFALETGLGRADALRQGASSVRAGHYMAGVALLAMPAVAFVAEELVRRWRLVAPLLVALFVAAVPANVHALVATENARAPQRVVFRNTILAIPELPLARKVPRTIQPYNGVASPVTVGWLLDASREGRVPRLGQIRAGTRASATLRISLLLTGSPSSACRPLRSAVVRVVRRDQVIRFRGAGMRVGLVEGGEVLALVDYTTSLRPGEWQFRNVGGPMTLRLEPVASRLAPMLCA